jgi:hypothetical protein
MCAQYGRGTKRLRRSLLTRGLWVLCGSPAFPAAAQPVIMQITVERDCPGCPSGSVLVLRRDGSASYTSTGKARRGTVDQTFQGMLRAQDFEHLARVVLAQHFFELNDRYEDPQLQDGPWQTIGVDSVTQNKRVFSRDDAGPPALKELAAAIEAVRLQTRFVPDRR